MEITVGKFKVKPYKNGLCWEVWELRPAKERGKADSKTASVPAEGELWQFTIRASTCGGRSRNWQKRGDAQ